jgi:hypothetical protein
VQVGAPKVWGKAFAALKKAIEHVWKILKDKVHKMYPDLWKKTRNKANIAYFTQCGKSAWWAIDQVVIDKLIIRSMPDTLQACSAAHGSYTRS